MLAVPIGRLPTRCCAIAERDSQRVAEFQRLRVLCGRSLALSEESEDARRKYRRLSGFAGILGRGLKAGTSDNELLSGFSDQLFLS